MGVIPAFSPWGRGVPKLPGVREAQHQGQGPGAGARLPTRQGPPPRTAGPRQAGTPHHLPLPPWQKVSPGALGCVAPTIFVPQM